jgi:hypothetical protein
VLSLPSSTLDEPGRYELSIYDAATRRLVGSYHFVRAH